MPKYDNPDNYEFGKEVRQSILAYAIYVIVALALVFLEIVATGWWTILWGPITIFVIILIARYRSVIRGFLGLKQKDAPEDEEK